MKRILLAFLTVVLPSTMLLAQQGQQTSWWYFGSNAGVFFNNSPSAVTNGQVNTSEGVATIADAQSNLLFYSDGIRVWNANHAVMTNGTGLMGNGSSAQSGVTVPRPGSNTEYYLFTVGAFGSTNGLRYSHIDMTASGGLGAVTASQKNVFLMPSNTEKIAVIPKSGGYWVFCPKANSDTIYAFGVTSAGVNTTPVKSATGVYTANPQGSVSYLKPNLQGTRLVGGSYSANVIALYDVNASTGVVSNGFTFTGGTTTHANYGVEFSPNGNMVYAQGWGSADCRQYDITSNNATTISGSEVHLGPSSSGGGGGGGAIQLGRDGKLYMSRYGQQYLDRIDNPDVYGTGAGYVTNAVSLNGRSCRWGLPTFIQAFFGASIEHEHYCFGDSTLFTADTANVDSLLWNFGDPNSGASNVSNELTTGHIYSDTGTFTVSLVAYHGNLTDTTYAEIFIYPHQTVNLGNDTSLCFGLEFVVTADQPFADFVWHDSSTDSAYTVSAPDSLIAVTVNGVCDTVSDTMIVDYYYPFVVDIGPDTSMCLDDPFMLNTGLTSPLLFTWSTGGASPSQQVSTPGTYSVTVTDGPCTYSDSVTVDLYPVVTVDLGHDSVFCYEPSAELVPVASNSSSFAWSTGSTSASLTVTQSGTYTITAYGNSGFCTAVDSVEWSLYFEPTVSLGDDALFCYDETITLEAETTQGDLPLSFLWNDNSGQPDLTTNLVGMYWVEVSDDNCAIRDSITISTYPHLDVELGEDIETCEGMSVTLDPMVTQPVTDYSWNDGSGNASLKVTGHGTYALTVTDGNCTAEDRVNVFYYKYPEVNLGQDTSLCADQELTLDATQPAEVTKYVWFDKTVAPTNTLPPTNSGRYWVEVTNVVCTTVDSITVSKRDVPDTYLGPDTAICAGDELEIAVKEDDRIIGTEWNTGEETQSIKVTEEGTVEVLVRDEHCVTAGTIEVSFKPEPTQEDVKLDVPETICIGDRYELDMKHELINAYQWQDGSTSPSYAIESEGLYWLKATHDCGVLVDTVRVDRCECPVWLPNAFNPDGDGNNDKFVPKSECGFINYRFSVYDRWGEQVFYTEDPTESWDGTRAGVKAPVGAYTYHLFYVAEHEGNEIEETTSGTVVLLR